MLRRAVTSALILAAVLVAGCGQSEAEKVEEAVKEFRDATAGKDYETICEDVLAKDLVSRLDQLGLPCETALKKYLGETKKPKITVRKVKVEGRKATADITSSAEGQAPEQGRLGLVKEDGAWRITSLGT